MWQVPAAYVTPESMAPFNKEVHDRLKALRAARNQGVRRVEADLISVQQTRPLPRLDDSGFVKLPLKDAEAEAQQRALEASRLADTWK